MAAMHLSKALSKPLREVLGMSLCEVQLWSAYMAPEEAAVDTSAIDGMCD